MTPNLVLAIDQGTTGSRALLVDEHGASLAEANRTHAQHHPAPGAVEHDAIEILDAVRAVVGEVMAGVRSDQVAGVGITNQRETIVVWDRATGLPIAPAIVWQDSRTAPECEALVAGGASELVRSRTGLPIQPYFSATKLAWLIDHVPGARARADGGELAAGTMDCWLAWNLTGEHISDVTNASRTLLLDIDRLDWDPELLALFMVPAALLPRVVSTWETGGLVGARVTGLAGVDAPLVAMIGDQQSALLGQGCRTEGQAKCTYGTGAFLLVNAGQTRPAGATSLLVSPASRVADGPVDYCLEGAMAVAGRAIGWLVDDLGLVSSAADTSEIAASVAGSDGVRVVPAFQGLYAPWWDARARGSVTGLTLHSTKAHVVRATLESLAFQTRAVLDAAERESGVTVPALKVDGGVTRNGFFVQALADILGRPVVCAADAEATIHGAVVAAGIACGFWDEAPPGPHGATVEPVWSKDRRDDEYADWLRAVDHARGAIPTT